MFHTIPNGMLTYPTVLHLLYHHPPPETPSLICLEGNGFRTGGGSSLLEVEMELSKKEGCYSEVRKEILFFCSSILLSTSRLSLFLTLYSAMQTLPALCSAWRQCSNCQGWPGPGGGRGG